MTPERTSSKLSAAGAAHSSSDRPGHSRASAVRPVATRAGPNSAAAKENRSAEVDKDTFDSQALAFAPNQHASGRVSKKDEDAFTPAHRPCDLSMTDMTSIASGLVDLGATRQHDVPSGPRSPHATSTWPSMEAAHQSEPGALLHVSEALSLARSQIQTVAQEAATQQYCDVLPVRPSASPASLTSADAPGSKAQSLGITETRHLLVASPASSLQPIKVPRRQSSVLHVRTIARQSDARLQVSEGTDAPLSMRRHIIKHHKSAQSSLRPDLDLGDTTEALRAYYLQSSRDSLKLLSAASPSTLSVEMSPRLSRATPQSGAECLSSLTSTNSAPSNHSKAHNSDDGAFLHDAEIASQKARQSPPLAFSKPHTAACREALYHAEHMLPSQSDGWQRAEKRPNHNNCSLSRFEEPTRSDASPHNILPFPPTGRFMWPDGRSPTLSSAAGSPPVGFSPRVSTLNSRLENRQASQCESDDLATGYFNCWRC